MIIIILSIIISIVGCSNKEKTEEEPYLKYIITTYSGGKEIEKFEVYSNMSGSFHKQSVTVYDSPLEKVLLFYTTLDYKLEEIARP